MMNEYGRRLPTCPAYISDTPSEHFIIVVCHCSSGLGQLVESVHRRLTAPKLVETVDGTHRPGGNAASYPCSC